MPIIVNHIQSLYYTLQIYPFYLSVIFRCKSKVIRKVLLQEKELFAGKKVSGRIVGIDRHYIHSIMRGKETKPVGFGAKVNNIQTDSMYFIEHVLFKAFNEGVYI